MLGFEFFGILFFGFLFVCDCCVYLLLRIDIVVFVLVYFVFTLVLIGCLGG